MEIENGTIKTNKLYIGLLLACGNDAPSIVKAYIMLHVNLECGLYFGSTNDTSKATKISKSTVVRVFKKLQEVDLIRLYRNGVWAVNPNLLMNGNSAKYQELMKIYNSLPKKVA